MDILGTIIVPLVSLVMSSGVAVYAIKVSKDTKKSDDAIEINNKIEDWYKDCLINLKLLSYLTSNQKQERKKLLGHLSGYIDFGRTYFRNTDVDIPREFRPELFKGKRVVPIDLLVLIHHIYEKELEGNNREIIRNLERAYVSEVSLYIQKVRKQDRVPEYNFTDYMSVLSIKSLYNPEIRDMLQNQNIIKYIKTSNKIYESSKQDEKDKLKYQEQTAKPKEMKESLQDIIDVMKKNNLKLINKSEMIETSRVSNKLDTVKIDEIEMTK